MILSSERRFQEIYVHIQNQEDNNSSLFPSAGLQALRDVYDYIQAELIGMPGLEMLLKDLLRIRTGNFAYDNVSRRATLEFLKCFKFILKPVFHTSELYPDNISLHLHIIYIFYKMDAKSLCEIHWMS